MKTLNEELGKQVILDLKNLDLILEFISLFYYFAFLIEIVMYKRNLSMTVKGRVFKTSSYS